MSYNALEEELMNIQKDKKLLIKAIELTDKPNKKQDYLNAIRNLTEREKYLLSELGD